MKKTTKQLLFERMHSIGGMPLKEDVIIDIMKNTEKAPYMGSRFGQDVEPKGTYVIQNKNGSNPNGWLTGKANLKNPLFVDVDSNNLVKYKYELSNQYKAKGENLTKKLMEKGYDGIITKYKDGYYGEIILFPNSDFMLN